MATEPTSRRGHGHHDGCHEHPVAMDLEALADEIVQRQAHVERLNPDVTILAEMRDEVFQRLLRLHAVSGDRKVDDAPTARPTRVGHACGGPRAGRHVGLERCTGGLR